MLSCRQVADRASALIDGELSTWDVLRIRLHLAMCKGCGRFVEQMRATDRLVAQVAELEAPLQHQAGDVRFAEILSMLRKQKSRR